MDAEVELDLNYEERKRREGRQRITRFNLVVKDTPIFSSRECVAFAIQGSNPLPTPQGANILLNVGCSKSDVGCCPAPPGQCLVSPAPAPAFEGRSPSPSLRLKSSTTWP